MMIIKDILSGSASDRRRAEGMSFCNIIKFNGMVAVGDCQCSAAELNVGDIMRGFAVLFWYSVEILKSNPGNPAIPTKTDERLGALFFSGCLAAGIQGTVGIIDKVKQLFSGGYLPL